MGLISVFISIFTTFIGFALLAVGVHRLYTIGNDLAEIKRLLRDAKQNSPQVILRE